MKKLSGLVMIGVLITLSSLPWLLSVSASASLLTQQNTQSLNDDELKHFAALDPIDTHTHVFRNDPAFHAMLNKLHLHLVDICVFTEHGS